MVEKINVKSHRRQTASGSTKVEAYTRLVDMEQKIAKLKLREKEALQDGDEIAVDEFKIHGDNVQDVYKNSYKPITINLEKKQKDGTYDSNLALISYRRHADNVIKDYERVYGTSGNPSKATRDLLAIQYRNEFETEYKAGNTFT